MSAAQLFEALHQQPFQPFRIVQTDGKTFDVRHPEMLLVGHRDAVVSVDGQRVALDLLHVIRLELLLKPPSPFNGVAGNADAPKPGV